MAGLKPNQDAFMIFFINLYFQVNIGFGYINLTLYLNQNLSFYWDPPCFPCGFKVIPLLQ